MDNLKLKGRSVLSKITKFNNEIKSENITSEPEEENQYPIKDSIVFEEDLKDFMVDETSNMSTESVAQIENRFSFRDSIIFKEEVSENMNYNAALQFQEIKRECSEMENKQIQLTPASHIKNIKDHLEYQESFRNAIVFKEDLDELYEDHIIKEEINIGPEVLMADQRNSDKFHAKKANKSKLNNKKQQVKDKKVYACICGTKSSQKKWFDNHTCKKNVFVCDHCSKQFDTKFLITEHMRIHQAIDQKCVRKSRGLNKTNNKTKVPHKCYICNKVLSSIGNLEYHIKNHLGTAKVYECDKCDKTFKSNEYLQYHISSIHLDSSSLEAKARQMACRYCSKICINRYQRNYHEKKYCTSNPEKIERKKRKNSVKSRIMTCDICQKNYRHKQSLISHILLHMGKKPVYKVNNVQCDLCSRIFTKKYSLRKHMLSIHLNVKDFSCNKCQKRFVSKYRVTIHEKRCHKERSDGRELKFKCDLCPNKYLGKTGLRFHLEGRHLGIKKFACQYCKVKYSSNWWRNTHEKKCRTSSGTVQLV